MKNIFSSWRKKSSKFSKFRKFRKSRFFFENSTFWHFEKNSNFEIFENFESFLDFENFENFWDFEKFWKVVDRKKFRPNNFRFFFDDLFRSQISPRFQKSHLENRVMSSKMWKSDFLRLWYTFTWPQGSDLVKIRLFDLCATLGNPVGSWKILSRVVEFART